MVRKLIGGFPDILYKVKDLTLFADEVLKQFVDLASNKYKTEKEKKELVESVKCYITDNWRTIKAKYSNYARATLVLMCHYWWEQGDPQSTLSQPTTTYNIPHKSKEIIFEQISKTHIQETIKCVVEIWDVKCHPTGDGDVKVLVDEVLFLYSFFLTSK